MLALAMGLAVGYAGGFAVGSRERPGAPADATAAAPTGAAATAGREFTETRVGGAPKASNGPAQTAAAPPSAASPAVPVQQNRTDEKGSLLVRSTPAGASITVDGRSAGLTPATVGELTRGTHRVRITHDGYVAEERRVVISRSRSPQSLLVPLAREHAATTSSLPVPATPSTIGRFAGELAVDSRPVGVKVFLDGKLIGTTPLAIPSVVAGGHTVRLEQDGYRGWSSTIQVVANERNRVTASLER